MKKNKTFRINTWGGLGDALLITPVIAALRRKNPDARIVVYCEHPFFKDLYRYNPDISSLGTIYGFRRFFYSLMYDLGFIEFIRTCWADLFPSRCYWKSAVELAGELAGVEVTDFKIRAFTDAKEDDDARKLLMKYEKPIIINPSSFYTPNKEWPFEKWESVIVETNATFIQVGLKNEILLKGAVDLRGRTSVRQTMALVKNATGYVGVDSFVSHLSNAFDIPAVIVFGPTTPVLWGHSNAINIWKNKEVRCAPCTDLLYKDPCPYDRLCMKSISVAEVVEAISSHILKAKSPAEATLMTAYQETHQD